MSNSNKHIEEFLDDYLNKEQSPDYAVLITGCWGSGKTYFIRQFLEKQGAAGKDVVKKPDWLNGFEKYTVVYVSLFGMKTREDINKKIERILHPKINSKNIKYLPDAISLVSDLAGIAVGTAVTAAMTFTTSGSAASFAVPAGVATKKASGSFFKNILMKIFNRKKDVEYFLSDFLEEIKKKRLVAIFDDVERADMPLPELLGYLNEYVEHLHVPCILLADKEKWEEAQKCQEDKSTLHHLSSTKEKVIGKEFQIQTSFDEVWNSWFNEGHHILSDEIYLFLKNYRDSVASIFDASKIPNFRSLKHTLFDMQRFIKNIERQYLIKPEFNSLLIADFIAHQYMYYLGLLNPYEMTKDISSSASRISRILNQNQSRKDFRIQTSSLMNSGDNVTWSIVPCNQNAEEELSNYEHFQKKFSCINKLTSLGDSFFANKWLQIWHIWLVKNYADYDEINQIIKESIWYDGEKEYYLRKMLDWFMLDDKSGQKALSAFEESLETESLVDPFLIMDLFYRIYWYSQQQVLQYSPEKFKIKMEEYVKSIKPKLKDRDMDSWKSQGWIDDTYKQFEKENEEFRLLLKDLLNDKIRDRNERVKEEFYTLLGSNSYNDIKRACDRITLYSREKFPFAELNVQRLCSTYQSMKNEWHSYFFNSLEERYKKQENGNEWNKELIKSEKGFLKDLLREAKQIYDNAERPISPSIFSFYYLIRTVNKILKGVMNDAA